MKKGDSILIAFSGPVGSGKTYIARILAKKLKAVHINTDEIRWKLKLQGRPISRAIPIARRLRHEMLAQGKSVIVDFDAVLPRRQRELRADAKKYGARFFLIKIKVSEKIILKRLQSKYYAQHGIFRKIWPQKNPVGVYFMRKIWHEKKFHTRPDFVIHNARLLAPQIRKVIKKLLRAYSLVVKQVNGIDQSGVQFSLGPSSQA